jgi:pyruvate kinase
MLLTKVVCTLGPATSSADVIDRLVEGGLDVARVNMSHGEYEEHARLIKEVRRAAKRQKRPVGILLDLQGPKIRVGHLDAPVNLTLGQEVVFAPEGSQLGTELPTTYALLGAEISEGDYMLLDDGLLELLCTGTDGDRAKFEVVRGGLLKSSKGMNLPTVDVSAPSLTEKDLQDLEFALEQRVEFVGLSFVRKPDDVRQLKSEIAGRALVVAKIEKAQALNALPEVLEVTDAVMVARGDLGVELPFEEVPMAQKRIVQMANYYGRPVITATQMLESMIEHARPTRAEASDVANAILDGTDAVMLSGETAVGKHPLKALEAIVRIAREIEDTGVLAGGPNYFLPPAERFRSGASVREHAVASATMDAVRQLEAPAIIVITRSGFSARLVSSYRAPVPIIGVCTDQLTYRELTMVWGVIPILATSADDVTYDGLMEIGRKVVLESGIGREGQSVVVTAGFPFHRSGSTNTMRIERL